MSYPLKEHVIHSFVRVVQISTSFVRVVLWHLWAGSFKIKAKDINSADYAWKQVERLREVLRSEHDEYEKLRESKNRLQRRYQLLLQTHRSRGILARQLMDRLQVDAFVHPDTGEWMILKRQPK